MIDEQKENLIIKILADEKNKISPNPEGLKNILLKLDVTNVSDKRFIFRSGQDKGRASIGEINQIYNPMTINWKLAIGVAVLAVVAVVSYYQFALKPTQYAGREGEQFAAKPTGNIDDAVFAVYQSVANEALIVAEEESDASLMIIDSQAISDFGQSYDENEF